MGITTIYIAKDTVFVKSSNRLQNPVIDTIIIFFSWMARPSPYLEPTFIPLIGSLFAMPISAFRAADQHSSLTRYHFFLFHCLLAGELDHVY